MNSMIDSTNNKIKSQQRMKNKKKERVSPSICPSINRSLFILSSLHHLSIYRFYLDLLLDGKRVLIVVRCIDDLISKAFRDGFEITERSIARLCVMCDVCVCVCVCV